MRKLLATTLSVALLAFFALPAAAQPTVDGDLSDSEYQSIATKQNSNNSFGSTEATEIVYFPDEANSTLYLGVKGQLPTGTDNANGIGIWVGTDGGGAPTGAAAGTELGFEGGSHYFNGQGGGTNDNFKADFEVDFMYAFNTGGGSSDVFFDSADLTGSSPTNQFVGSSDQSGSSTSGTGPGGGTITFAVDNSGGADTGIELQIPFSELGATAQSDLTVFAFVVSSTGFFSDETVPGDLPDSGQQGVDQPGFNADFSSLSTGPFNSSGNPLPVELADFTVRQDEGDAVLNWTTASETNNAGFRVQHAAPESDFGTVGFVEGAGTTQQTRQYQHRIEALEAGTHRFRLEQVDTDGTTHQSAVVELSIAPQGAITIDRLAPTPVQGTSTMQFTTREAMPVTVALYNLLGQRVETLYQGQTTAGQSQRVTVDGSTLSSGVYFLRVEGNAFTKTERVTVVR
jgi:hypothetical protein